MFLTTTLSGKYLLVCLVDQQEHSSFRQSLYDFEDCKAGNRQKSEAAANALKRIYPSVNSKGVSMKIPMPGHPISASGEFSPFLIDR